MSARTQASGVGLAAAARSKPKGRRLPAPRLWRRLGSLVLFVTIWHVAASLKLVSPLFLPPPATVLAIGIDLFQRGELQRHIIDSLGRILKGFTIGSLVGIVVGMLMGTSRIAQLLLRPSVELLRPLPALVWIPLVLIWFGIGEAGKIYLIAYGVFFVLVTNTFDGTQAVNPTLIRAARSLGASRRDVVFKVFLPATAPQILTGLSVGIGTSFSVLVAAELLAAVSGLGWMITDARRFFRTEIVLLGMTLIGTLGILLVSMLNALRRRLLPWHDPARE